MALQYLYQGQQITKSKNESRYKQTLFGSKAEVQAYRDTLTIGSFASGKGYLQQWRVSQKDGDIYQIEVEYTVSFDGSSFSNQDSSLIGRKSAQLSVRTLQMPLQSNTNYKTRWNYYLITNTTNSTPPQWAYTKTDILLSAEQYAAYRWVKTLGEVPIPQVNGVKWRVILTPSKPGLEYYQLSYFVVTITAKYNTPSEAGTAISKQINHIVTPLQDFGLNGSWKYDQASVQYDGKNWIATQVYTRAVDHWDTDLYSTANN